VRLFACLSVLTYSRHMSKKQKKRTKRYTGEDAKATGVAGQNKPVVHHYEATQRTAVGQWVYEHKRSIKYSLVASGTVIFLTLLIMGVVQSLTR